MSGKDSRALSKEDCSVLELLERAQKEYEIYQEINSVANPFIMSEERESEKFNWDNPLTLSFIS